MMPALRAETTAQRRDIVIPLDQGRHPEHRNMFCPSCSLHDTCLTFAEGSRRTLSDRPWEMVQDYVRSSRLWTRSSNFGTMFSPCIDWIRTQMLWHETLQSTSLICAASPLLRTASPNFALSS